MLAIINRSRANQFFDQPYQGDGPAILAVHTIDRSVVCDVLTAWAKNQKPEAIFDMLKDAGITDAIAPLQKNAAVPSDLHGTGKFFVSVDEGHAPSCSHNTSDKAFAEAERLAAKHPNRMVRVMRQIGWRRAEQTVRVVGQP